MTAALAFVVLNPVAPARSELEVAAIRTDPDSLAWRAVFAGRETAPGVSAPPDAPREMSRAELAAGLAAVIADARVIAWDAHAADDAISRLLADAGRTEHIDGVLDLASLAAPFLEAAGAAATTLADATSWMSGGSGSVATLAQAAAAVQLYGRVQAAARTTTAWASVRGDEARIAAELVGRLTGGRTTYGPWHLDDHRDLRREALDEIVDGLHYAAAELVRSARRRRVVYVATGLPPDHAALNQAVSALVSGGALPLLPWQIGPQLMRDGLHALDATRMLLETADEVRVVGDPPVDLDLVAALASALDVPVVRDAGPPS